MASIVKGVGYLIHCESNLSDMVCVIMFLFFFCQSRNTQGSTPGIKDTNKSVIAKRMREEVDGIGGTVRGIFFSNPLPLTTAVNTSWITSHLYKLQHEGVCRCR